MTCIFCDVNQCVLCACMETEQMNFVLYAMSCVEGLKVHRIFAYECATDLFERFRNTNGFK
jgi:hypothetical protein